MGHTSVDVSSLNSPGLIKKLNTRQFFWRVFTVMCRQRQKQISSGGERGLTSNTFYRLWYHLAQRIEQLGYWSEGCWFKSQLWAELHVKVSLSKTLNQKLLLICGWHLAWWPLPSVSALQRAGDLFREYSALAQRQLGLVPAKTPTTPSKG